MIKKILSKNNDETADLAKKLALSSARGDIFALQGDLGSGKTTFVQDFAKALGVSEPVNSPTFVIAKIYPFVRDGKKIKLVHIDAYRLKNEIEAENAGILDLIGPDSISMIEWPENIWPAIADSAKKIDFKYIDVNSREISFDENLF